MMFMPAKVINSSEQASQPRPSIATFDPFIAIKRAGMTTGKLRTAIKVKLLPAFEAIIEFNVNALEKAADDKNVTVKNSGRSAIGLPNVIIKSMIATEASKKVRRVL